MIDLPRRQKQLHDLLLGRGDVAITELFAAMRIDSTPDYDDTQAQQRWLAPYITMLNDSLSTAGLRVQPGDVKQTYRLVALA